MSKLYIFGIGGTGSRVLRAVTMLAASGVEFGQHEIIPIIIDPDKSNADMTRTVGLMDNYIAIRKGLNFNEENPNRFFREGLVKQISNFNIPIKNTNNLRFSEFINIDGMSRENKAMIKMLFSDANLNSDMCVGFKGNPNIGSVVLNQIVEAKEFEQFANSFEQGDKIFVISSIFGGTGASGFPLLVKTLRTGTNFPNHALINKAEIGAITILPYFRLKTNADSSIDSGTFISKAKSALAYYEKNLAGGNQVNAFYYLGDTITDSYDNCDGGINQRNKAHLIELLAATAVVDFSCKDYDVDNTVNKELGINDIADTDTLSFSSFDYGLRGILMKPMTQFVLMSKFISDKFDLLSSEKVNANKEHDFISSRFYHTEFIAEVRKFVEEYIVWLNEMAYNKRPFRPFNLNCGDNPFTIVEGVKERTGFFGGSGSYDKFIGGINDFMNKLKTKENADKFLELFYSATEKLANERLNIK